MKAKFVLAMLWIGGMAAFTSCQDPASKTEQKIDPKKGTKIETNVEYTCPMHPEVVQSESGKCPKCGMALEVEK